MKRKKNIAILGSTGSIGTQALEIIRNNRNDYRVEVLVANSNVELLAKQAHEFEPNIVIIADESKYDELSSATHNLLVKIYTGAESVEQSVATSSVDIVLVAMVGFSGLLPTLAAIKAGKRIALANKETLVVAGNLIMENIANSTSHIIPVDSEHSAIFQCLNGENIKSVRKLILTASGGPFRNKDIDYLKNVTVEQALSHPNWNMGNKISIDSATMMNKGLEVIEAFWLFGVKLQNIDVLVHPQSIIHSMVEFVDGSIIAQLGSPDMKVPIKYAFDYPDRLNTNNEDFSFYKNNRLDFEQPDLEKFPCLSIAYEALKKGGNTPCVLNAANEVAVSLFLENKISFLAIPEIIEKTIDKVDFISDANISDYLNSDNIARINALEISKKYK